MKWELQQPKDKYYVPVFTIKWLLIAHFTLFAILGIMLYGAWNL